MAPQKKAAKKTEEAPDAASAAPETAEAPVKSVEEATKDAAAAEPQKDEVKKDAAEAPVKSGEEVKKDDAKDEAKAEGDDVKEEEVKAEEEDSKAEDTEMKEEPPAEEVKPVFKEEEDAAEDKRPKIKASTEMLHMSSATPNVMASEDGGMLMTLCDGGCQYLLAGVQSSVGIKAGRYMFEFKILEMLNCYEASSGRGAARPPQPKQLVRVGFSLAGSDPLLLDGEDQVYFDSEGNFVHNKTQTKVAYGALAGFRWGQTIGVLVNLDDKSPHANTVSIFRDGARLSQPQPLPEAFVGKAIFPAITYKNVTLQVNWGPAPNTPLPFTCRMLRDAAAADVEVVAVPSPAGGKHEVLFPVGLPEQGVFDWLDQTVEEKPTYLEISDRKVLSWAEKSGLYKPKGSDWAASQDKPGMSFGIPAMENFSVQKALMAVAPALKRNFICMELNSNLQASERARALKRFPTSDFKRVAVVLIGEPTSSYKERIHKMLLAEKVEAAARDTEIREAEKARVKMLAEWSKQQAAEQSRKRKANGEEDGNDEDKDGEDKEADNGTPKEGDEEAKDADKTEEATEEAKPVELTAEEKAICFRKLPSPDIAPATLTKCFANYSIPVKDEGFDEIRYVWSKQDVCSAKFKEWLLEKKNTERVEDLEPSAWFKEKWATWEKTLAEWNETHKNPKKKAAKKEDKKEDAEGEKKEENGEDGDTKMEVEKEKEAVEIDEEDIDVYAHEDINDIGNGKPLFANFVYEDWTLLSLRYELHLLVHAFRRDVADPDRPGFHESHLLFYFDKYFRKSFDVKLMGLTSFEELCALIKDSAALNEKTKFVEAVMPEEAPLDKFLRDTENHRRERQQCVDAGDESALLKFTRPAPPQRGGGGGGQRGGYQSSRDSQWDRNSSRPAQSDKGSSWGSSSYGDRGSQEKRSYAPAPPSSAYPAAAHGSRGGGRSDPYGSSSRSGGKPSSGGYETRSRR